MPSILLDPGHGGATPQGRSTPYGARGPQGTYEKDVNLALARRVQRHLDDLGVALTRQGDENLSLAARQELATRARARTLLSIHTRSHSAAGDGAEVWVHERSSGPSRRLASAISEELGAAMGQGASLRSGPLALLHPDGLPTETEAALIEVGALEDPDGERALRDPQWLDTLGAAIARGVRRHYGLPLALHPGAWSRRVGGDVSAVHRVDLIPQPRTWGCWAAAAAMVKKYQDPANYYDAYAIAAPLNFTDKLDTGLADRDVAAVARQWGLVIAADQNWTVEGFAALLRDKGPLWVSTNPGRSVHDICVTGIEGDGTPDGTTVNINNPWPVNRGAVETLSYTRFVAIYERRASGFSLIVHAPAARAGGRRLGAGLRANSPVMPGMLVETVSEAPAAAGSTDLGVNHTGRSSGRIRLSEARRVVVWFERDDAEADLTVTINLIDPSIATDPLDDRSIIARATYDLRGPTAVGVDFRNIPANGPTTQSMDNVQWRVDVTNNANRGSLNLSGRVYGV